MPIYNKNPAYAIFKGNAAKYMHTLKKKKEKKYVLLTFILEFEACMLIHKSVYAIKFKFKLTTM